MTLFGAAVAGNANESEMASDSNKRNMGASGAKRYAECNSYIG
jgi:hypothetical protein